MALVYWIHKPEHTDIFSQGYVGVTSRELQDRLAEHEKVARLQCKGFSILHRAINSYGLENLVSEIVLICEEEYAYTIEEKLRPDLKIGWNLAKGGDKPPSKLGFSHSEESKIKISAIWKGRKRTPESVAQSCESRKGFKHSEETKERLRESSTGRKQSPETINKRLEKVRGQLRTEDQRSRMSERVLNLNPWERSGANKEAWLLAEVLFDLWKNKESRNSISKKFSVPRSTLSRIWKHFSEGWLPAEDENWISFVSQNT